MACSAVALQLRPSPRIGQLRRRALNNPRGELIAFVVIVVISMCQPSLIDRFSNLYHPKSLGVLHHEGKRGGAADVLSVHSESPSASSCQFVSSSRSNLSQCGVCAWKELAVKDWKQ